MSDNDQGRVAGNFTFTAQMPNGKQLSMSCYVLAGTTVEELNRAMDQAAAAVERQRLFAEIPELEVKLKQRMTARNQVETIIEDLSGKERVTPQDKQTLNTQRMNLKMLEADIEEGIKAIQNAREQLAA